MSACAFKSSARALGQVCTRLVCLLPSICHCYYSMQRRTHVKQRRAECPVNVLQAYSRQSETTSTITLKSFENFRRHFLKINFRYNVRFLTSTATYIYIQISRNLEQTAIISLATFMPLGNKPTISTLML